MLLCWQCKIAVFSAWVLYKSRNWWCSSSSTQYFRSIQVFIIWFFGEPGKKMKSNETSVNVFRRKIKWSWVWLSSDDIINDFNANFETDSFLSRIFKNQPKMSSKSEKQVTTTKNSQPFIQEQNLDSARGADHQIAVGPVFSVNGESNSTWVIFMSDSFWVYCSNAKIGKSRSPMQKGGLSQKRQEKNIRGWTYN